MTRLRDMGRSGTVVSPILVGRDGHLELAEARLDDVAAGHGRSLLIAGEAGVGKTRYLAAVLRRARTRGFTVLKGDIGPQDRDVPGGLILDLVRTMRDVPDMASIGRVIMGRWGSAVDGTATRRRRLVHDVVDTIVMATDRPLVLAFEDLQWADDLSLEIIAELARVSERRRILVIAAHRRDETAEDARVRAWRARLLTQRLAEEVRIDRFTLAQTSTMVTLLLGTGLPAPRDLAAALHERSDGLPLHIEELVAAARGRGAVDAAAIRSVDVPDTIEDAVLARTSLLSPEAQAVARAGAVLGRCFVPDVLAGIMDIPVDELERPLDELVRHAILYPFGARDEGYHDFRHQLLRDALYRHIPTRERRRYHARAAEFGAALPGHTEVHASLHYARAGLRDEAFRAALAGARAAARVSAHREAADLYARARAHQPADLEPVQRGELLEESALEALALEDMAVAEPTARAAAAAFRDAGEPARAIGATAIVLALWRRDGHPVAARIALARELLAELDGLPPSVLREELRGDVQYYLAHAFVDGFAFAEARPAIERALASAAESDSTGLRMSILQLDAAVAFVERGPDVGLSALDAVAREALAARSETAALSGMRDTAVLANRALDYGMARASIDAGIRFAAEVEQSHCAHVMAATGAVVDWATGAWDEADAAARQVLADPGCRRGASTARWAIGYVAMGRGAYADATTELVGAERWAEEAETLDLALPAAWGVAETALLAGEVEAAAARCERAFVLAADAEERALLIPFMVTGARAYLAAGRPDAAARWCEGVTAHLARFGPRAAAAIAHGAGLVALANGATGAARRSLLDAVSGWDAIGRVWEASWARLDLASAFARAKRHASAVSLAGQVLDTAARLGSPALAARAEQALRQARGRTIGSEPWHPLTTREFEVARLVGAGRTNVEIAERLGIAPKTASAHIEHILAKLGASRRAEIATWASRVEGIGLTR